MIHTVHLLCADLHLLKTVTEKYLRIARSYIHKQNLLNKTINVTKTSMKSTDYSTYTYEQVLKFSTHYIIVSLNLICKSFDMRISDVNCTWLIEWRLFLPSWRKPWTPKSTKCNSQSCSLFLSFIIKSIAIKVLVFFDCIILQRLAQVKYLIVSPWFGWCKKCGKNTRLAQVTQLWK